MEEKEIDALAKKYAEAKLKYREAHPDFPLEYLLSSTYKKGWRRAEKELNDLKNEIHILSQIILRAMDESYLANLKKTFADEGADSKLISKINNQIEQLQKQRIAAQNRIGTAVKRRNKMLGLHKARLSKIIDNDKGKFILTTED